jgi:hypothetical protein
LGDAEDQSASQCPPQAAQAPDDHRFEAEDQARRPDRRIEVGASRRRSVIPGIDLDCSDRLYAPLRPACAVRLLLSVSKLADLPSGNAANVDEPRAGASIEANGGRILTSQGLCP